MHSTRSNPNNKLANEKSPYLLQHKNNPVNWNPYSDEAFQEAKKSQKPILISIGYATCHWCHVMEKESFEDEKVAEVLNKLFVPIKVDREEMPDVDSIYMNASQLMGQGGGWPLNVFCTPDLKPFYAGTYFPKDHFIYLLNRINSLWTNSREEILNDCNQVVEALKAYNSAFSKGKARLDESLLKLSYTDLERTFDPDFGGFGKAPKFPPSVSLKLLLRIYRRTGEKRALEMVEKTLNHMAYGGIYDHIGGGFARYSTDKKWAIPHFEKMLYDNAFLSQVYTEAFQATGKSIYKKVAMETLDYVLRVLTRPEGGFYSAEDADSEGVEGKFYVWTKKEIESILTPEEAQHFCKVYEVTDQGNFEHGTTNLCFQHQYEWDEKENPLIVSAHKKLFEVREKRVHPLKDDKILTSWNGMMIASMAYAARVFGEEKYHLAAQKAANFIKTNLSNGSRLLRRYREGESKLQGTLDDYVFFIWGLIELFQTDYNYEWLNFAVSLQKTQDTIFWDEKDKGYFFTSSESQNLIVRTKDFTDAAYPCGNNVSTLNLQKLYDITYDEEFRSRLDELFTCYGEFVTRSVRAFAQLNLAIDYKTDRSKQLAVILGNPDQRKALSRLWKIYNPNSVVVMGPEGSNIPILEGKKMVNGQPTFYLCEGKTCKAPSNDFDSILKILSQPSTFSL